MAADGQTEAGVPVRIEVNRGTAPDAILHVSYFSFTRIGSEVIFEVGNVDHSGMVEMLREPAAGRVVRASVLQRFGMSIEAFERLKGNVDELWQKMQPSSDLESGPEKNISE